MVTLYISTYICASELNLFPTPIGWTSYFLHRLCALPSNFAFGSGALVTYRDIIDTRCFRCSGFGLESWPGWPHQVLPPLHITSQSNLGVIPPKFLNLTFITLFLRRFIVNIFWTVEVLIFIKLLAISTKRLEKWKVAPELSQKWGPDVCYRNQATLRPF